MTKILSADCVHQNILQYYSCNKVHARHDHESFGVSDAGFPSLYRVSTVPQRLQRSTSQGIVPHYTSAAHAEGHTTHGNSARCSSPRCTYVIRYDRNPGFPPSSLSPWSPSATILRPKTFTRKPATTFLFPCFFFLPAPVRVVSQAVPLAYLVIFSVCFSHSHSHFAARARGGGKNAPSQQQKLLVSLTGSSIIDHRVAEDQSPDRSTRHINADTRRTGHHRHRLSLQAGSCSHPRFYLFCEFDPDRMCSIRKETCRALVGWLVLLLAQVVLCSAVTPCGSARGGGGARRLSTSVRPFVPLRRSTPQNSHRVADRYLGRFPCVGPTHPYG